MLNWIVVYLLVGIAVFWWGDNKAQDKFNTTFVEQCYDKLDMSTKLFVDENPSMFSLFIIGSIVIGYPVLILFLVFGE